MLWQKSKNFTSQGKSLLEDGKFDDALRVFEQALLLNQDDPDFVELQGYHITKPWQIRGSDGLF